MFYGMEHMAGWFWESIVVIGRDGGKTWALTGTVASGRQA